MSTEMFRLQPAFRWGRLILGAIFYTWGLGGLFFFLVEATLMMRSAGDDIGSSAGAAMATVAVLVPQALIWIGGILFFGIATLLVAPAYRATKQNSIEPY
jgi:hypothetical protein